jgi:hypothetical protein
VVARFNKESIFVFLGDETFPLSVMVAGQGPDAARPLYIHTYNLSSH